MSKHRSSSITIFSIITVLIILACFSYQSTLAASVESSPNIPNSPNCHVQIGDFVWNDMNGNGIQDIGEPGLPGVTVDLFTGSGVPIASTTTDANGLYSFQTVCQANFYLVFEKIGLYNFSPQYQGNDITIDSDADPITGQTGTFTVSNGEYNDTMDAGLAQMDFGDLPSGYANTMLADDGARHTIGNLMLGDCISAESDGQEDPSANGDTCDDGIALDHNFIWQPTNTVYLTATVTGGSGYLVGWFDWDNNGDFAGSDEMPIAQGVSASDNVISLIVPDTYTKGQNIFTRFRLYETNPGTPSPTGLVTNGEVEDHLFTFTPDAIRLSSFSAKTAAATPFSPISLVVVGFVTLAGAGWIMRKRF